MINCLKVNKVTLLTLFIMLLNSCAHLSLIKNDEKENISYQFSKRNFTEAIELSKEYLIDKPEDILVNHYLGRSLYSIDRKDEAAKYFKLAIQLDKDSTWVSSWSYLYLGDYYSEKNDTFEAKKMYKKVIELDKTKNSVFRAKQSIFNLEDFKKDFTLIQTDHINFYFEKYGLIEDIEKYTREREDAFVIICSKLKIDPNFTIDFYVWNDSKDVYNQYGVNLGFSISEKGIIHSSKNQTIGHELTHTIVYHIYKESGFPNGLINEGIAVYFDLFKSYSIEDRVKAIEKSTREKISMKDLWSNWGTHSQRVSYPIAGGFVDFLIEKEGIDNMILILSDQSFANAKKIYGNKIELYIEEYESWLKSI